MLIEPSKPISSPSSGVDSLSGAVQLSEGKTYLKKYKREWIAQWRKNNPALAKIKYKLDRQRRAEKRKKEYRSWYNRVKGTPEFQFKNRSKPTLWEKANPDKRKAHSRLRYLRHRDYFTAANAKRRAIKRGAKTDSVADGWIRKTKKKRTFVCYYCQDSFPKTLLNVDHIVPLSKGGHHVVENLCASCEKCNKSKNAKSLADFSARECIQSMLNLT